MTLHQWSRSCFLALTVAPLTVSMFLATARAVDSVPHMRCEGEVCIDVLEVGDVRNAADAETGHGAVDYAFAIGRHEVTVGQYLTFLNTVAADLSALPPDKRGALEELWQEDMINTHSYVLPNGMISRNGSGTREDPYVYREVPDPALGEASSHRGVLNISWFAAARFANWMHNGGRPDSTTETGAYTLEYRRKGVAQRNPDARWWLPSQDEWYKAAYFDRAKLGESPYWNYPTRSDALPVAEMPQGGVNSANYNSVAPDGQKLTPAGAYADTFSPYGAYDMAGSLWEWCDTSVSDHDGEPETMVMLGGSWSLGLINLSRFGARDYLPEYNDDDTGFRLATTVTPTP